MRNWCILNEENPAVAHISGKIGHLKGFPNMENPSNGGVAFLQVR